MSKHSSRRILKLTLFLGTFLQIYGQQPTITLRLVGTGATASQGRVEIERNGIRGSVCNDRFDDQAAAVVCRQLNFPNGGTAITDGRFGPGTGPIWLDDVTCQGNENHIELCISRPFNESNCDHSEDVGVICNTDPVVSSSASPATTRAPATAQPSNCTIPSSNIRLIGPSNLKGIGYVEVNRNGVWGSICDDEWGTQDARVVCRMLCYDPSISQAGAPSEINYVVDQVSTTFLLDDVQCVGTETDIDQCPKSNWGVHNCDASKKEFASVTCVKLENKQPLAPIPELECSGGKFYARFSRIQDPYLETKHLTIFYPYTGPCIPEFQTTTDTVSIIIKYSECGTATKVNDTHIIYSNSIKYDYTVIQGQIVRVNTYRIDVSCEFPRDLNADKGVTPLTETVTQKAPGTFTISMKFYNDSFNTALNGPIQLTLGEWLNVALTLEAIDPNLKLIVPDCKATPTNDPNDPTIFGLFDNKCASDPTLGFFPLNSTVFGFRYQTFKFVSYSNVVLQCDAFVCLVSEKNAECDRTCQDTNSTSTTGRKKRDVSNRDIYRVISPPMSFGQNDGDVIIDRGDGWEVNLITTREKTTPSMSTKSFSPTTPKTDASTTTKATATTKVVHVTSSSPTSTTTTKATTQPPTSNLPTEKATTQRPTSNLPTVKATTQRPTTNTPTPKAPHSESKTSRPNPTKEATSSTKNEHTGSPTTSLPSIQGQIDPDKIYVGGIGAQINILSHASSLHFGSHFNCLIVLLTILMFITFRYL